MEISGGSPDPGIAPAGDHRPAPLAAIVYLSGRNRGKIEPVTSKTLFLGLNDFGGAVLVTAAEAKETDAFPIRLHRSDLTYEMEVDPSVDVWVNGEKTNQHILESGELIEIGRNGPMLRYRIYDSGDIPGRTTSDAFSDCIDCAKYSDGSLTRRAGRFMSGVAGELVIRTPPWIWISSLLVIVALITSLVVVSLQNRYLEKKLVQDAELMHRISEILQQSGENAVNSAEISQLRSELGQRVGALEARTEATRKIISATAKSIAFLQGSYTYLHQETGKPLRYVGLDPNGQPLRTRLGPAVTMEGDGPLVEMRYTGTAFLVGGQDILVTNRHIAVPWENNPAHDQFTKMGLVPQLERFIGFLPGVSSSFDVRLAAISEDADIAVLRCEAAPDASQPLDTGLRPVQPGDEVIVMGYPTGIRAMLARTHSGFLDDLDEEGDVDFWKVVEKLSESGLINPLATRGIVGQVTADAVVYDADTTSGGSGGPVLNMEGKVIAVNAAILPEFGGSNLGVPIAHTLPVLEIAGSQ